MAVVIQSCAGRSTRELGSDSRDFIGTLALSTPETPYSIRGTDHTFRTLTSDLACVFWPGYAQSFVKATKRLKD